MAHRLIRCTASTILILVVLVGGAALTALAIINDTDTTADW